MQSKSSLYRRFLCFMLANAFCLLLCFGYIALWQSVPGSIRIRAGQKERMNFSLPASGTLRNADSKAIPVSFVRPLFFYANEPDSYEMDVRLFGVFPLKNVNVQVIEDTALIPAGIPIGIYVKTEGVLVIGTGEFTGFDGLRHAPSAHILQSGDYILEVNHIEVTGKRMFMSLLQEQEDDDLLLTIRRGEQVFDVKVEAAPDQAGVRKIGIWIRDNAQGVGTLTYVDESGNFGALGHGINDMDTGTLMELKKGNLYHTDIIGITRGSAGSPGELTGLIDYSDEYLLGRIVQNEEEGIFGVYTPELTEVIPMQPLKIGLKQETRKGPAQILCSLDGKQVRAYDAEIADIQYDDAHVNREILLRITDPELIRTTGGIIQGMSGAPILQDGKLVGAVTHVFVQDATKGYGIFIEEMLGH